ncbi:kynurenine formamidase [Aspergillus udagawae]|uniref:Kynurenine formamidase n=1 Tax=Aspergillus udagawae TaxID=91492 RepID=A0ABQ1ALJ4_9EURO|nr:kynurenine formamidase [Aspergillus udagawae]GFF84135.1 kynurenine formamidase [Aspergillus udagawae]GFG02092.1 kynurenine formamidase [Aspergillus udagawae]GFG23582.1 kynurenine formamidase [Aspergillus udagawae]
MPAETLQYGDHKLQTVTISTVSDNLNAGYWVILIHGGAWRDPTQTAISYLSPAESILTTSPTYNSTTLPHIAAFASIEYRLSAHPGYPQSPDHTDPIEYRNAKHPDHIRDVQAALGLLQRKFGFGTKYILVGHSAGATLAFQSVMGAFQDSAAAVVSPPAAILGMAGIYDLRLLRDTHRHISAYQEFIEGAFGSDEAVWDAASPASVKGSEGVEKGWTSGRLAVLSHSPQDGLVDAAQQQAMQAALSRWEDSTPQGSGQRRVEILSVKGDHDDAWMKGDELARAIAHTLAELQKK